MTIPPDPFSLGESGGSDKGMRQIWAIAMTVWTAYAVAIAAVAFLAARFL